MKEAFHVGPIRLAVVAAALISALSAEAASPAEQEDQTAQLATVGNLNVFVGVRAWANRWDVPVTTTVVDPQTSLIRTQISTELSDTEITAMPVIGVRYDNWLASLTYFADTSYSSNKVIAKKVKRSEYDLNVGYYVLPSLLISLGYKHAEFDRAMNAADSGYKIDGILVGATASAPLSDKWSVYGSLAFGLARERLDSALPNGDRTFDGEYKLSEVGLAYRFFQGSNTSFLRSATFSIGYRSQDFTLNSIPEFTFSPAAPTVPIGESKKDVNSGTSGFVISLIASF